MAQHTTAEIWDTTSWSLTCASGSEPYDLRQYSKEISCDSDDQPCSYRARWCGLNVNANTQITITQSRLVPCIPFDVEGCKFTLTSLGVQFYGYQRLHHSQHETTSQPPQAKVRLALRGAE